MIDGNGSRLELILVFDPEKLVLHELTARSGDIRLSIGMRELPNWLVPHGFVDRIEYLRRSRAKSADLVSTLKVLHEPSHELNICPRQHLSNLLELPKTPFVNAVPLYQILVKAFGRPDA